MIKDRGKRFKGKISQTASRKSLGVRGNIRYCRYELRGLSSQKNPIAVLRFWGLPELLEFIGLLAFVGFNLCEYQVVGSER
jgi:hypothetical protein